eukprot:Gb_30614 [translate_table: standard]
MAFALRRLYFILCRRTSYPKALLQIQPLAFSGVTDITESKRFLGNDRLTFHILKPYSTVSRDFSSKTDLNHVEGPVALDYSSVLPEEEFHRLADETLHDLQEKLEAYGDDIQIDGFDIDYASGVLTVKLGNLGTYVLNKQTPNRQLWLSSPVSGPARFDWDRENQAWIYRRTKADLLRLLENELSNLLNASISLVT